MTEPRQIAKVNFLLAGTGRAGTTWIHYCLKEHPEAFLPIAKELHFFGLGYDKGLDWYEQQFKDADPSVHKAIGEMTPAYLHQADAAEQVARHLPDVKLMFLLREPIARAYAHYTAHVASGRAASDADHEMTVDSDYVSRGFYFKHLQPWLDRFDRDKVLILLQDDLKDDSPAMYRTVCQFIGVDPAFEPSVLNTRVNSRKGNKRFSGLHRLLIRSVGKLNNSGESGTALADRIRGSKLTALYHKLNRKGSYPQLSPDAKAKLAEALADDVRQLGELLGRDLSHWTTRYTQPSDDGTDPLLATAAYKAG